jgi:orotidine-5'-phosphate decarboxylase
MTSPRDLPEKIEERLIVALDVPSIGEARELAARLDGIVTFFKLVLWLQFAQGFGGLIAELVRGGKRIFLDAKMYDIGETVKEGVRRAAERGVSFVTVHGDGEIMKRACEGRGGSGLKIFAVTVLTSLGEEGLRDLGFRGSVAELVRRRAKLAALCGCDGIIAAPRDNPGELRRFAGSAKLLVATPGVRPRGALSDDHKRAAMPGEAIGLGADYLIVGRPIIRSADPAQAAAGIIEEMRLAAEGVAPR